MGIEKPTTLPQLQHLIKDNPFVRAFAAGHSGIIWPSGTHIDMTSFDQILGSNDTTVVCQAAVTVGVLSDYLISKGKMVEGLPSIRHATIGGVILTAAHGTGHQVVASQ